MPFLSLVTLTFGLDLQTGPSENPFSTDTQTEKVTDWCQEQNLTQFIACGKKN